MTIILLDANLNWRFVLLTFLFLGSGIFKCPERRIQASVLVHQRG